MGSPCRLLLNSDGFILFCNQKYKSLFPLTGELRKPGAFLPSILALSKENGEAPGLDPKTAMRKLKEGVDDELELYNGAWLRIRSNPVDNGNTIIVVSDVTDMKKAYFELRGMAKKLELLADTDGLTGLFNRRSFDERLEQEISRCRRNRQPISLIMIDVDRFKAYNDHYGHQAGDTCLQTVAKALEGTTKRPADFVARYGGEEMCIVLPETEQSGAFVFAEHVRLAVNRLAIAHAKSEKSKSPSALAWLHLSMMERRQQQQSLSIARTQRFTLRSQADATESHVGLAQVMGSCMQADSLAA